MTDFRAILFEKARSIQDMLDVRKCFSARGQAGIFFMMRKSMFILLSKHENKQPSQSSLFVPKGIFVDLQLAITSVLDTVYNMFGLRPLLNLHLFIFKLLKYLLKYFRVSWF